MIFSLILASLTVVVDSQFAWFQMKMDFWRQHTHLCCCPKQTSLKSLLAEITICRCEIGAYVRHWISCSSMGGLLGERYASVAA